MVTLAPGHGRNGFVQFMRSTPSRRILFSFAAVILAGTLLLLLPQSNTGTYPGVLRALFTATSATCVTGLVIVDTGSFWSPMGQFIIMMLIQIGGLGYMVLTTVLMSAFRRSRLRLHQTGDFRESLPTPSHENPRDFARVIALTVIISEGVGAFILSLRFLADMPPAKAVWNGLFTSVSAFCNAGFEILGNNMKSLEPYVGDLVVNIVVSILIILGGLGFIVINEIVRHITRHDVKRLSTHTRTVLIVTAILVFGGAAVIFGLENSNAATYGSLPFGTRVLASWFQSVTARTAGFDTVAQGTLRPATLMVIILFMFIGASPGGTGGGVKTTTFAVVLAFVWASLSNANQTHLGKRGVRDDSVKKSIVVFTLSLGIVIGATFLLAVMDGHRFSMLHLLFSVVSAFGTVGLSTGITANLSAGSQIVLIATMLAGRVGVLTAMLTLFNPDGHPLRLIRLAEDDVAIG